jgi:hypothetical protein
MAVNYTTAVKNSRMSAVVTAIGAAGVLEIGTTGMALILATVPLANPAGTVAGGVMTFTMPRTDASADGTGTAAAARIRTATGGTDIVTGLTVGLAAADIIVDSVNFTTGQQFTVQSANITHA